eukprot:Selendium_serpulae@DN5728_c0_g1_i2.p1
MEQCIPQLWVGGDTQSLTMESPLLGGTLNHEPLLPRPDDSQRISSQYEFRESPKYVNEEPRDHGRANWVKQPYGRLPFHPSCTKDEWDKYLEWLLERRKMREGMTLSKRSVWTIDSLSRDSRSDQAADKASSINDWVTKVPPGKSVPEVEETLIKRSEKFEKKHRNKEERRAQAVDRKSREKEKKRRKGESSSESDSSSDSSDSSSDSSATSVSSNEKTKKRSSRQQKRQKTRSKRKRSRSNSEDEAPNPISAPKSVLERLKCGEAVEVTAPQTFPEETATATIEVIDEDDEPGPKPLESTQKLSQQAVDYGGALRPGEGEAMAQFVQAGKRIPRRGEVGYTADQIEDFETLGYVMSGSR